MTAAALTNQDRHNWLLRYRHDPVEPTPLRIGQRVKFGRDARWWTVRGKTDDTVVLTRQATFRPKGDLAYTVIDWRAGVRGPFNTIGRGWNVHTDAQCQELAELVRDGEWEISQRNWALIDLVLVHL